MLHALEDLSLKQLFIIYPGDKNYAIHEKIRVVAAQKIYSTSFD
jgi:hypothetical protein